MRYRKCFLLCLLLVPFSLLLFCFQQFICSLCFWFFSWIHVIIKFTTICSSFSQSLMRSGICWRLLKNTVPYLLYWQSEVWGFLVASIYKHFPSLLLTGPFLPLKFPHGLSLFPNMVLSYHSSACFNFCFQCRSIYLVFQSLLEFSACSCVFCLVWCCLPGLSMGICPVTAFASQGLLAYLILVLSLLVSSCACSGLSHTGSEYSLFFFSSTNVYISLLWWYLGPVLVLKGKIPV